MTKPLHDVRVLELGRGASVAAAGAVLADLGADVVRVALGAETPAGTDLPRLLHHRGKTLVPAMRPDLEHADVVVTDLDARELEELGVSAGRHLIAQMSSIPGSALDIDENAAFFTAAGATGLMMNQRPLHYGAGQGARSAAFALTTAVLVALRQRDQTGRVHQVSASVFAAGVYSIANDVTVALGSGTQPARHDRARPINPLGNAYRAADGKWLLMGAASGAGQESWQRFHNVMDGADWLDDARFATPELRRANTSELVAVLDRAFDARPRHEWGARLTAAGFNWNPIAEPAEAVLDTQLRACGVFQGDLLATPLDFDQTPLPVAEAPAASTWSERVSPRSTMTAADKTATPDEGDFPLAGIRVIDVSNFVAAPGVGSLLVDLGAEVIKVEPPEGDPRRNALTHLVAGDPPGLNRSYHMDNRGKRSIALNLKDAADLAKLKRLVRDSDVFLTNLLPGRQMNFGLAPDDLLALNPRVVYVSLSAHGTRGPDAALGGFDVTAFFARSGLLGLLTRQGDGPPRSRSGQGDHIATLVMMTGLLAALRQRDATGRGRVVETSLLQIGAYNIGEDLLRAKLGLPDAQVWALADYYQCADGSWLQLAAPPHDHSVQARVDDVLGTVTHAGLAELFASRSRSDWAVTLDRGNVPWVAVHTLPEMLPGAPDGLLAQIALENFGAIGVVGAPYRVAGLPTRPPAPGPAVGEHSVEIIEAYHL